MRFSPLSAFMILAFTSSVYGSFSLAATDIAITVDDLPVHGPLAPGFDRLKITHLMLDAFKKHGLTNIYGFINGQRLRQDREGKDVLKTWIAAGQLLGNHTWSHLDLAKTSLEDYQQDISANDPLLREMMGDKDFHWFRFPFLAEGETHEKRTAIREYLSANQYKIAEVTVDFFDYEWNEPYIRCLAKSDQSSILWLKKSFIDNAQSAIDVAKILSELDFGRSIKHVLLVHIGLFEAEMMDELLSIYEASGVKFIDLPEAASDPVYQTNPDVVDPRTYTFLNQIRHSKGRKNPPRVTEIYNNLPEDRLADLCR